MYRLEINKILLFTIKLNLGFLKIHLRKKSAIFDNFFYFINVCVLNFNPWVTKQGASQFVKKEEKILCFTSTFEKSSIECMNHEQLIILQLHKVDRQWHSRLTMLKQSTPVGRGMNRVHVHTQFFGRKIVKIP